MYNIYIIKINNYIFILNKIYQLKYFLKTLYFKIVYLIIL